MFFTNHTAVLALVAENPDLRLREIAAEVGITERATHRIVSELVDDGYLARERAGSRSQYTVMRFPPIDPRTAEVMRQAIGAEAASNGRVTPASSDGTFRAVFDAVPAGAVVADETGAIMSVNREFCAILGRTEAELLGTNFREYTHPDDVSPDDERLAGLVAGELAEFDREKRYLRHDGSVAWVRVRVVRTADPETGAPLLVVHVVEIGERIHRERELAEAEERFRSAFDNAPIGMALVAPDGRWLKVNQAMCEITGYSETALLTSTFQSMTHPDDLEADLEAVRELLAGEIRTYQLDRRYHDANGRIIWLNMSVSLVRDSAGEPLYFIAQIKDITNRRAAEESTRRIADRIAEAVSIIDSDGTRLHVNDASRAILDDLKVSFVADRAVGIVPGPEEDSGAIAEDGTALTSAQLPVEITRLTGEEIDEAIVGFPSASEDIRWLRLSTRRLSDGRPPYQVIVSFVDVTRRKRAERALALSQARLGALFRYIPAALSLRDLEGRYLHVTDSVARAMGRTPEDLVGHHPSEHLSGELLDQTLADDEAIRATGDPITREATLRHADGSEHDYYILKWPVMDENGAVAALGAFSLDITDRRYPA
jgi:PAS domain S-box-containing protein